MSKPEIAQKSPYAVDVEEGQSYLWCTCGKSAKQPFCDAAHKGTEFKPIRFKAEKTEQVWLCGCKQTGDGPFCDGTHNSL